MTHRMSRERLRKQIAFQAARLLHDGRADDADTARRLASRQLVRGWTPAAAMPHPSEVLAAVASLDGQPVATGRPLPEPYATLRGLLAPLAHVQMPKADHPEGDALYHSLQTLAIVAEAEPYDLELMLAALLHEVGRSVDAREPVIAGLATLDGLITERTAWLLTELPEELRRLDCDLGVRATRRLARHEDGEALTVLARADRAARVCGGAADELDDALQMLADLETEFGADAGDEDRSEVDR